MVQVNGTAHDIAGQSLAEYLRTTAYQISRIAVERNGEIVSKAAYETTWLTDGDILEIVSFVGGG